MNSPGPVLAVDYGARRLGLAISEPESGIAFPVDPLVRRNPAKDLADLRDLATDRQIARIVVGLPIHMDGSAGPEAEAARSFSVELERITGLTVELLDERWTTREAERSLREVDQSRKSRQRNRQSGARDSAAAAILLRTYLERSQFGAKPESEPR